MLFKKNFGELVQQSLTYLRSNTDITNTNIGGITRSIMEIISKNIAEYYDILDINTAMSFLSTAEGYYLDLIGKMFNMARIPSKEAGAAAVDGVQKFYVVSGVLFDKIPTGVIPLNTTITSSDGLIAYNVTAGTTFSTGVTEVYVPIIANSTGSKYNVGQNTLVNHNLGIADVFTTNERSIVSGTDTESDANYKYRLMNATLSAEKANEISVRLAALSVDGVAEIVSRPFARGIGTFDIVIIPVEGIATDGLVRDVQNAIDEVRAFGIQGTVVKPSIVTVDIEVRLVFTIDTTDFEKSNIRTTTKTAIEKYIANIPLGGVFILNELRQQIMDVSQKIKDHVINCYYFKGQPTFIGNVEIYWDEMFYPNPKSAEAIRVI